MDDDPRISSVSVTDEVISATLTDGRTISVPLAWSWRLSQATSQQRQRFEIIGNGHGVHWPDVDKGISALAAFRLVLPSKLRENLSGTSAPAPRP